MTTGEFHGLRAAELDEVDRSLVLLLQADGRSSVSDLARAVGLSHPATRQRLNRLLAERIITIGAMTHPGTHGYGSSALIAVETDHRIEEVASEIAEIDQVYYVVTTTGRYDVMVELMARDAKDLLRVSAAIRSIPGVRSAETLSFVDTVKWVYRPGFDQE
ncbi:Lrp/AsnC family transcriptional regulator [Microbacterium oxydans]|uniref:Lrp/AsnC family transcriptional regulator n=1 Tax=Microbacterium oxydans TaxID=82380 RepID=UPI0022B0A0E1|nr:Lrp/AsnC family transcriptional regulator [Microbacterium oxydans]MCZ4302481.1 Lrp/AsnC family transcriptional regulator [Microbacterium oxydans]